MTLLHQIPFSFDYRITFTSDEFLVTPKNMEAVKWIDSWPDWPSPIICVFGPPGCGKTHLSEVFRAKSKATNINENWLNDHHVEALPSALIMEDISESMPHPSQVKLFHLYNYLNETNGHMLITANLPPAKWELQLKDLRSRLNTVIVAEIKQPDDNLMTALLTKMFSDRQLIVSDRVIAFAISHMERSFTAARLLVEHADNISLVEKRKITLNIIKKVIDLMDN